MPRAGSISVVPSGERRFLLQKGVRWLEWPLLLPRGLDLLITHTVASLSFYRLCMRPPVFITRREVAPASLAEADPPMALQTSPARLGPDFSIQHGTHGSVSLNASSSWSGYSRVVGRPVGVGWYSRSDCLIGGGQVCGNQVQGRIAQPSRSTSVLASDRN